MKTTNNTPVQDESLTFADMATASMYVALIASLLYAPFIAHALGFFK